jgi:hypothetical protein
MRRIEEGATPRGPWKKYRHESGGRDGVPRVDAGPFVRWWNELPEGAHARVREHTSIHRRLREVVGGRQAQLEISTVVTVGDILDDPGLASRLYPYD